MIDDIVVALGRYYESQGIAVGRFRCKSGENEACGRAAGGIKNLWCGSEAYVGRQYGRPFRLLVANLDRGSGSLDMRQRRDEVENCGIDGLNPHMAGTLSILCALLNMPGTSAVWQHFSMINTAKCCTRDGTMSSHESDVFFKECAPYATGELDILRPHLLVTQGKRAELFIKKQTISFSRGTLTEAIRIAHGSSTAPESVQGIQRIRLLGTAACPRTVVFHTVHTSAWQGNAWQNFFQYEFPALYPIVAALAHSIAASVAELEV